MVKSSSTKNSRLLLLIVTILLLILLIWLYRRSTWVSIAGNDRFGLSFISAADNLADDRRYEGALAAGARWDRWPLYWNWVAEGGYAGPHEGGEHDYDALVTADLDRGLTPLVILMGTPPEQAAPVGEPASPLTLNETGLPLRENPLDVSITTLPPQSLFEPIYADGSDAMAAGKAINSDNVWAAFVFTTVERYRPGGLLAQQHGWADGVGVRHWEVWNEPDFEMFWRGSVEEYYRLLEVAYKSIKTADPEAVVLLGGLAFYEKPNWLGQFLRQTSGNPDRAYFDVFSMHHYWSVYNSEARLVESRTLLDAYGLNYIPIWITESGVSVWDDYPATAHEVSPDAPWRGTKAEQAAYVIQHAALSLYNGAQRYFHFMLHDDCGDGPSSAYGLRQNFSPAGCNPADGQPRPAYAAYRLVAEQFQAATPLWREKQHQFDQAAFYRPQDQSRVLVLWATQGMTTTVPISATGDMAQLYWIDSTGAAGASEPGFRREAALSPENGRYSLTLPPATNQNAFDPTDTSYHIGGRPYLLVERDTRPPQSTVAPLPESSPPTFLVTWGGEDRGSGVAGYDVWAAQDDQPLTVWLTNTTITQAEYSGEVGRSYRFAVRARDRAGNAEPTPTAAQASTQVVAAPEVTGVVLGPNRELVPGAEVIIDGANTQRRRLTDVDGTWPPVALLPGDYTATAGAPDYGSWPAPRSVPLDDRSETLLLTLAPLDNAVAAGDFEGSDVWSRWDWAGQVDLHFRAFDGEFAGRLGQGNGEAATCSDGRPGQKWLIQQPVTIPATDKPVLSFVHRVSTPQPSTGDAWLEVNLLIEGELQPLAPPGELTQPSDWTLTALDVSDWRGQTGLVQFQVVRCSEQPFTVALDRVSLGTSLVP